MEDPSLPSDGDSAGALPPPFRRVRRTRGGVSSPFPLKLHRVLDAGLDDDVICWMPHGRCFVVKNNKAFVDTVMPKYFKQTKITSFQRQLNLYGFTRLTSSGPDKGGYYHELFLRGRPGLTQRMKRMKVKGTGRKGASNPEEEPDFYRMEPVRGGGGDGGGA
uniref:HSF-type DNA-binding domain-containing protein n=1 Tax=Pseudictyota dubia TaxID=2749911 RepID=A0A7R9WI83_9STRA